MPHNDAPGGDLGVKFRVLYKPWGLQFQIAAAVAAGAGLVLVDTVAIILWRIWLLAHVVLSSRLLLLFILEISYRSSFFAAPALAGCAQAGGMSPEHRREKRIIIHYSITPSWLDEHETSFGMIYTLT